MTRPADGRSWLGSPWPYLVGGILLLSFVLWRSVAPSGARPAGDVDDLAALRQRDDLNLLFILIDTLRADRLGSYGYARDTTPHMDRLAEQGIRLANHLAQSSWTKASMASLWTGLYPARTGVLRFQHALPNEAVLPAEIFRDAGFQTIALWRNGWVAPNFGFSQGFESYTKPAPRRVGGRARLQDPAGLVAGTDADIVASAEEFLRSARRDERWFLYLHMMDVHQYLSDRESTIFGTTYSDYYDNAIHWTDRLVGQLVDLLERRGLLDRTVIAIASDHGEAFREHGTEGHARNLYAEVTRTPVILSLPFRLPSVLLQNPSENVDLWPTLLDLFGLPALPQADGESLLPRIEAALRGEPEPASERPLVAHLDGTWGRGEARPLPMVALELDGMRAFAHATQPLELYDLEADPGEQRNVADARPEEASHLREVIDRYLAESAPPWKTDEVEVGDLLLNQLRALGYKVD